MFKPSDKTSRPGFSGALTQGGQTSLHGLHMLRQVMGQTASLSLVLTCMGWLGWVALQSSPENLTALGALLKAPFLILFSGEGMQAAQWVEWPGIKPGWVLCETVLKHSLLWDHVWMLGHEAWRAFLPCLVFWPVLWGLLCLLWVWRGQKNREKRLLDGDRLLTLREGRRMLKKAGKPSGFELGGLPLPEGTPQRHILLTGTTGSGKTNALRSLLSQIRARGDRALVVDLRGTLMSRFMEKGDTLLNPLDTRSPRWNVFEECAQPWHTDLVAECLVPQSSLQETFWTDSARTLLSTALQEMRGVASDEPHKALVNCLIQKPLHEIQEMFRATVSSALVDPDGEKMVASVRATLTQSLKGLLYCDGGSGTQGEVFSLRRWIGRRDEPEARDWLWLVCTPDQRSSLRTLMTAWVATAVSALKSLPETSSSRLWIVIDELPQMGRIPCLAEALEELRAFGGCVVAGIQDIHQLDTLYSGSVSRSLLSLFNTKVMFRMPSREVASRMTGFLGHHEVSEKVENISYGSHAMRDGVSLQDIRREKAVVKPDDLMALKTGEAVVRMMNHPPVRLRFEQTPADGVHELFSPVPDLFARLRTGGEKKTRQEGTEERPAPGRSSGRRRPSRQKQPER